MAISGTRAERLNELAAKLGSRVVALPCDLRDRAAVTKLAEDAAFLRNLTPTRVAGRARGESPTEPVTPAQVATEAKESLPPPAPARATAPPSQKPARTGPNPFAVIGIAFVAGFAVGRLIAWRSDAYPRH